MKHLFPFLTSLLLVGCAPTLQSLPPLTNVDKLVAGPSKYWWQENAKKIEIHDRRVIAEVVEIANLQFAKPWKYFQGVWVDNCSVKLEFFSGNSNLGNLEFSGPNSLSTFIRRPLPDGTIAGRYTLQEMASGEVESLKNLIGSDRLHGICPIKPLPQKGANPAVDPVRFALWTLRDEAAQRRSP